MKRICLAAIVLLAFVPGCGDDGPFLNDVSSGSDVGYDVVEGSETEIPGHDSVHPVDSQVVDDPGTENGHADVTELEHDATSVTDAITPYDGTPPDTARPDCDMDGITCIFLQGDTIVVDGPGAVAVGATVTVNAAGTYSISGTLNDGQIRVDTTDSELVKLLLNGMSATSSTSSPLYVVTGNNVEIFLVADTVNTLTDAVTYVYPDAGVDEPNAALFSKADLDITGLGALTIAGRFNDGINCKDGLDIMGGTIVVSGVDDGIRGKDNVSITGGSLTVTATNNGIKSDNETDADRGYINVEAGTVRVTSGGDAITAQTSLTINGGSVTTISGGGSGRTAADTESAKGLKGIGSVVVTGGVIDVDSADDGVHSDNAIVIGGGTFTISSADDGFHGEETLEINGGEITVAKSYEGLESKEITINDGIIHLTSSDDGINVAGGDGSGGWNPGGTGETYYLYINGGYVWMNAGGDGLDSNGNIIMTGGTVLVNGPTDNGNGPIDIGDGGSYYFKISGGYLVAAGSSGMAVGNSTSSTQYGVLVNLSTSQTAGTIFHLETSTGTDRLSFKPAKKYQSVFFSSPELGTGSHVVYLGGSDSGTLADNLYSGGAYSPGTQYTTFSISSTATKVGSGGGPGFP